MILFEVKFWHLISASFKYSLVLYLYATPSQSPMTSTAIGKRFLILCKRLIFLENKDRRCDYYLHNVLKIFHYFKYLGFFETGLCCALCMQCMVTEHPLPQRVQAKGTSLTALCKIAIRPQMLNWCLQNHSRSLQVREIKHRYSSLINTLVKRRQFYRR